MDEKRGEEAEERMWEDKGREIGGEGRENKGRRRKQGDKNGVGSGRNSSNLDWEDMEREEDGWGGSKGGEKEL